MSFSPEFEAGFFATAPPEYAAFLKWALGEASSVLSAPSSEQLEFSRRVIRGFRAQFGSKSLNMEAVSNVARLFSAISQALEELVDDKLDELFVGRRKPKPS